MVVLVIFVFLRNVSATLIPSLALPISIIGTFAAMNLLGYTLDNLSLMALTLSVGFVVDDAIVVLENIVRHLEMGQSRMLAAHRGGARNRLHGSLHDSLAHRGVHSGPVHERIMGRLFHEFAVTIMVAILISGFVSISLTPMLCSRFLRPPSDQHNAIYRASEKVLDGMLSAYAWALRGVMRHRFATMIGATAILAATIYLAVIVPKGFIPSQDIRQLQGNTEARQDISFDSMSRLQQKTAAAIKATRISKPSYPLWVPATSKDP